MTCEAGLPAAVVASLSIAAAVEKTLLPASDVTLFPPGSAAAPTRRICASLAFGSPRGESALSAVEVAAGTLPPVVSRIGARSGGANRTLAATPSCQDFVSTRVTAVGRVTSAVPGNAAWAPAAASATASAPPTRVVLRVAKVGKPSCCAAFGWSPFLPISGVPLSSDLPHPIAGRATRQVARSAAAGRRGIRRQYDESATVERQRTFESAVGLPPAEERHWVDVTMWATTALMDLVGLEASLTDHPAREVVPRREELPAVRGHCPGPAAGGLARAGGRARRLVVQMAAEALEQAALSRRSHRNCGVFAP